MLDGMKANDFFHNAACGFAAGFITGMGCSVPEYMKVKFQTEKNITMRSFFKFDFWLRNWKSLAATAPVFGMYVGLVCAIEFSINSIVAENYGSQAGLIASATTAAFFLTPADQFMLRKDRKISYQNSFRHFTSSRFPYLFTGFTPMFWREWFFGFSVLYMGPKLGEYLKQHSAKNNSEQSDLTFRFLGTLLMSLVTTTISHPFDSFARRMHVTSFENNYTVHPRLRDVAFKSTAKELSRGYLFRLGIAGFGGASIGTLFKWFKETNACEKPQALQTVGMTR